MTEEHPGGLHYVAADAHRDPKALSPALRAVLDEINDRVAAAESVPALIDFVRESTRDFSPCDRVSVAFLEDDGRRVVSYCTRADYQPILLGDGYAEDLAGSSLQRITDTGQIRQIDDLAAYAQAHPDSRSSALLVREGVRSSLTIPLAVDDRRVGLLFRSSRRANAYQPRHAAMQWAIGQRLSQAIEKAWRIEQLDAANRSYREMLSFVSHELKSPIAGMMMDIETMAAGYLGPVSEDQKQRLDRAQLKGRYLLELVEEYLNLARLEGGGLQPDMTPGLDLLTDVVSPVVEICRPQIEQRHIDLAVVTDEDAGGSARPATLRGDPSLLRIVAVNLLSNAVKYGREGGEVRVEIGTAEEESRGRPGPRVTLSVWNEGPGFTEAERGRLFRKFSRLDDPELRQQKGTGVGLYTVWRIVQMHGGKIRAESQKGSWARFTVALPADAVE